MRSHGQLPASARGRKHAADGRPSHGVGSAPGKREGDLIESRRLAVLQDALASAAAPPPDTSPVPRPELDAADDGHNSLRWLLAQCGTARSRSAAALSEVTSTTAPLFSTVSALTRAAQPLDIPLTPRIAARVALTVLHLTTVRHQGSPVNGDMLVSVETYFNKLRLAHPDAGSPVCRLVALIAPVLDAFFGVANGDRLAERCGLDFQTWRRWAEALWDCRTEREIDVATRWVKWSKTSGGGASPKTIRSLSAAIASASVLSPAGLAGMVLPRETELEWLYDGRNTSGRVMLRANGLVSSSWSEDHGIWWQSDGAVWWQPPTGAGYGLEFPNDTGGRLRLHKLIPTTPPLPGCTFELELELPDRCPRSRAIVLPRSQVRMEADAAEAREKAAEQGVWQPVPYDMSLADQVDPASTAVFAVKRGVVWVQGSIILGPRPDDGSGEQPDTRGDLFVGVLPPCARPRHRVWSYQCCVEPSERRGVVLRIAPNGGLWLSARESVSIVLQYPSRSLQHTQLASVPIPAVGSGAACSLVRAQHPGMRLITGCLARTSVDAGRELRAVTVLDGADWPCTDVHAQQASWKSDVSAVLTVATDGCTHVRQTGGAGVDVHATWTSGNGWVRSTFTGVHCSLLLQQSCGVVSLSGGAFAPADPGGVELAVLPPDVRPTVELRAPAVCGTNSFAALVVETTGRVTLRATAASTYNFGLIFRPDARISAQQQGPSAVPESIPVVGDARGGMYTVRDGTCFLFGDISVPEPVPLDQKGLLQSRLEGLRSAAAEADARIAALAFSAELGSRGQSVLPSAGPAGRGLATTMPPPALNFSERQEGPVGDREHDVLVGQLPPRARPVRDAVAEQPSADGRTVRVVVQPTGRMFVRVSAASSVHLCMSFPAGGSFASRVRDDVRRALDEGGRDQGFNGLVRLERAAGSIGDTWISAVAADKALASQVLVMIGAPESPPPGGGDDTPEWAPLQLKLDKSGVAAPQTARTPSPHGFPQAALSAPLSGTPYPRQQQDQKAHTAPAAHPCPALDGSIRRVVVRHDHTPPPERSKLDLSWGGSTMVDFDRTVATADFPGEAADKPPEDQPGT